MEQKIDRKICRVAESRVYPVASLMNLERAG